MTTEIELLARQGALLEKLGRMEELCFLSGIMVILFAGHTFWLLGPEWTWVMLPFFWMASHNMEETQEMIRRLERL